MVIISTLMMVRTLHYRPYSTHHTTLHPHSTPHHTTTYHTPTQPQHSTPIGALMSAIGQGNTPLMMYTKYNTDQEMYLRLLRQGANVKATNSDGTPTNTTSQP